MCTAWYEWNIAGIKELHDTPGTYLFMRAILTDDEASDETKESLTESQASHKSPTKIDNKIGIHITGKMVRPTLTAMADQEISPF